MGFGVRVWESDDEDQAVQEGHEEDMNALADVYYKKYIGDPAELEKTHGKAGAAKIKRLYLQKLMKRQ